MEYYINKIEGAKDFPTIHDASCMGYVLNPMMYQAKRAKVEVELGSKHCDGKTIIDYKNHLKKNNYITIVVNVN